LSRLVVVSNRVAPATKTEAGNQGGLAVAVLEALRHQGGVWFGWSGQISEEEANSAQVFDVGKITYATVNLSQQDYDEYYTGFANSVLWPLFHYRLDLTDFSRRDMVGYYRVNVTFASKLAALLKDDDLIWVHDYHFIPMAECLRQAGCKQRVGFFLHIPWPQIQVLLALPNHEGLVRALCSYDLLGFQTESDLRAFHEYITHEVGGEVGPDGVVKAFGRTLRAETFPIGIDTEAVRDFAAGADDSPQIDRLRQSVRDRKLVIGVDRLDYSKGLVQRMEAFEHLMRVHPSERGKVVLLQIAPPSRTDVKEYQEIRQQLESTAGHINAAFAEFDWTPIRYLNRGFRRKTLAGFLRLSHVGLVTPLRDGMNLVAKEYVAAQSPQDPGVLVLSRFAGAAREMDAALIVNPYDVEGVGETLEVALRMPLEERKERWQVLYDHIARNDVVAWLKNYLSALAASRDQSGD